MSNRKYNINPPTISNEEIAKTKNFDSLINKVKVNQLNKKTNLFKSKWFLGLSTLVVLITVTVALLISKNKIPPHEETTIVMADTNALKDPDTLITTDLRNEITPPIPKCDVPYEVYTIDAEKGGEIVSQSGSFIQIKPNSFFDGEKKLIKGSIKIKYREFHNPLGIFLSGIPMRYDSAGKEYIFESAGMLELRAEQHDKELALDEKKGIDVDMVSFNNESSFNIYHFDEKKGKWDYIEKSNVKPFKDYLAPEKLTPVSHQEATKPEPVKFPQKQKDSYCFTVDFNISQFPELNKDVIFEVDEKLCVFDPLYYKVKWDKISLEESTRPERYTLKLKKGAKEILLESYPVLPSDKYAAAIDSYHKESLLSNYAPQTSSKQKYIQGQIEGSTTQKEIAKLLRISNTSEGYRTRISMRNLVLRATGLANCDTPILVTEPIVWDKSVYVSYKDIQTTDIKMVYNTIGNKNMLFSSASSSSIKYSKQKKNNMWILLPNEQIGICLDNEFKDIKGESHTFQPQVYSSLEGLKKLKEMLE